MQINEFFVEGGEEKLSHVLLHISEPSTPEEQKKGYFFALCEINNGDTRYLLKLQEMIDQTENSYYEMLEREDKNTLEAVLEKVNQQSYALLKPDAELHCLVGVLRDGEIAFAFYGAPRMVLSYKNRHGVYQMLDLVESNRDDEPTDPPQIFPQIIQGKISPDDYLFVATPHVTDYFNHNRLQKIITSRPAEQTAEHLQKVLSELKNGISFGGLIIHYNQPHVASPAKTGFTKGDSNKSLRNFFNTERHTEDILSPSLLPKWHEHQKIENDETLDAALPDVRGAQIIGRHVRPHHGAHNAKTALNTEQLSAAMRASWRGVQKIMAGFIWLCLAIWQVFVGLFRLLGLLFFVATNYQNRRSQIIDGWRRTARYYHQTIIQLPLFTKVLLIAAVIAAVIFTGSILFMQSRKAKAAAEQSFNAAIAQIRTDKDTAESALIYNDEANAAAVLLSAKERFATLDCDAKEHKTACDTLREELDNLSIRTRKTRNVSVNLLLDLSTLPTPGAADNIIKVGNKLLAFSDSAGRIFLYDLFTREHSELTNGDGYLTGAVPKENDYALFLSRGNRLTRFDPSNNTFKQIDAEYPNPNANIKNIVIYNRKLYALDTANEQIYKHDSIKTGFARGKDWVTGPNAGLKNGTELTIDGDIFVLKNTGEIIKFTTGANVAFTAGGIDPALQNGGQIYSYADWNYLYILDPKEKRLIVLYKDGRLKEQLLSQNFTSPTGLVVDEPGNKAYVIDSNKLYEFPLK